jgi:hypothetical protein
VEFKWEGNIKKMDIPVNNKKLETGIKHKPALPRKSLDDFALCDA